MLTNFAFGAHAYYGLEPLKTLMYLDLFTY